MSGMLSFYAKNEYLSAKLGEEVYKHIELPIDVFNAACDHYGFVKERTAESIVRCRDCKFYGDGKYATHCYRFVHKVEPDGFCAWGEKAVS